MNLEECDLTQEFLFLLDRANTSSDFARESRALVEHLFRESRIITPLNEYELHEMEELEARIRDGLGSVGLERFLQLRGRVERRRWLEEQLRILKAEDKAESLLASILHDAEEESLVSWTLSNERAVSADSQGDLFPSLEGQGAG